jgi:hypothetical protein
MNLKQDSKIKKGTNRGAYRGCTIWLLYHAISVFRLKVQTAETLDTDTKVTFEDGNIATSPSRWWKVPGMSEDKFKNLRPKQKRNVNFKAFKGRNNT